MGILSSKWISKSPKAIFTNILGRISAGPGEYIPTKAELPGFSEGGSDKDMKSLFKRYISAGSQVAYQEGAREASLVWMAALLSCV